MTSCQPMLQMLDPGLLGLPAMPVVYCTPSLQPNPYKLGSAPASGCRGAHEDSSGRCEAQGARAGHHQHAAGQLQG